MFFCAYPIIAVITVTYSSEYYYIIDSKHSLQYASEEYDFGVDKYI